MRSLTQTELTQLSGGMIRDEDAAWVSGGIAGGITACIMFGEINIMTLGTGVMVGALLGPVVTAILLS